jgi:uncharacterized membrane-anchored protein
MFSRAVCLRVMSLAALCALILLRVSPGHAQSSTGDEAGTAEEGLPWQPGPAHVDLGHELGIDLSDGYMFLPKEPSAQVLERMGNLHHDNLIGLLTSTRNDEDWFVVIHYYAEGHVADDETIDAGELLSGLREGNEEANVERKQRGFEALTLEGWAEPPHYDRARHQLVWALIVGASDGKSVNYNTRVLGRHGFASLNLVTDPAKLDAYKADASKLLAGTAFNAGARYEDFDAGSDKSAEYGLAGLIAAGAGVGAAKVVKLGLLAKFWKVVVMVLIAGKKAILVALVAGGAYLKKLLGARRAALQPPQE